MNDEKKDKKYRLAILRMLISSKEISSQRELLQQLAKENVEVTQATLSRDLKQLKVAKAASMNGSYVYVLPNETMYKRRPCISAWSIQRQPTRCCTSREC